MHFVTCGLLYEDGKCGLSQDYELASKYYVEAADLENKNAEELLNGLVELHKISGMNYEHVLGYYASKMDNPKLTYYAGLCCEYGVGVNPEINLATQLFEKAVKNNDEKAINHYADFCFNNNSDKCIELYNKSVELFNNSNSLQKLGRIYYLGLGIEKNYEKAFDFFSRSKKATTDLARCYYLGKGTEKNIDKAIELYESCIESGDKSAKYQLEILKKIGDKKIISIDNITELSIDMLNSGSIGAVQIEPKENQDFDSHTLYSVDDYKKCLEIIDNDILKDVPNNNGTNQAEIITKVCSKLANEIEYDDEIESIEFSNDRSIDDKKYTRRNLIGGLLEKKSVCAGYSEILRNVLLKKNIDCKFVGASTHAFNQVKVNDKWYNLDLTFDISNYNKRN